MYYLGIIQNVNFYMYGLLNQSFWGWDYLVEDNYINWFFDDCLRLIIVCVEEGIVQWQSFLFNLFQVLGFMQMFSIVDNK